MIFSSSHFIFLFLPILIFFFYIIRSFKLINKLILFSLFSLFFYGFYQPALILLLISSIIINYSFSVFLVREDFKKLIIFIIILTNLLILFYFKYSLFFFSEVLNLNLNTNIFWEYALPIGISFFTFQQISYQIAIYNNEIKPYNLFYYFCYISFFPQLIAGPIVRHNNFFPQMQSIDFLKPNLKNFEIGISIFSIGVFKKIFLADSIGHYVDLTYDNCINSDCGQTDYIINTFLYSFQIYFDFSAYTDMAIGIAKIFGIDLPINFRSPYKSKNLINFWRNWHITLSNFLRDFIYIPLGGNKKGENKKYFFLFITMLIGGVWHGAGFNFILWGGLHGIGLIIVNILGKFKFKINFVLSVIMTFIFVSITWIFFRSDNIETSIIYLLKLINFSSVDAVIYRFDNALYWFSLLLLSTFITFFMPNTFTIIEKYFHKYWFLKYFFVLVFVFCLTNLYKSSDFIYYKF